MKKWDARLFYFLFVLLGQVSCQAPLEEDDTNGGDGPPGWNSDVEWVNYSDFGAVGDGKTDDISAIVQTHEFANKHGLKVKADDGANYYISGKNQTVNIQTDTDFGNASFIIDDIDVENRHAHVFSVNSSHHPLEDINISSLKKNQQTTPLSLPGPCFVTVTDAGTMRFIRYGANQNDGFPQTDIFIVDKSGNIDKNTPIIWDFDRITSIVVQPIDEEILTISGGQFTTIANREPSRYTYYARGLAIKRSNVVIDGIKHRVEGEGKNQGAPYSGFIHISNCANVTVKNTTLTGRKVYTTTGSGGVPVSMGSYDININSSVNITFQNCRQTNEINDNAYWGIMESDFSKNLVLDNCTFSRFDAHMGVINATIKNSTLGYQGINAIGRGDLIVENTTIHGNHVINLRADYGSTWQGEFFMRDCTFVPRQASSGYVNLIGGSNTGQHDFGYQCYMPERITIENLVIDDSKYPANYRGPAIFANFNEAMKDDSYVEKYPYIKTKEVIQKSIISKSGRQVRISDNTYMFKDVEVIK